MIGTRYSRWGCWLADRLPVFPVTSPLKSAETPANDKFHRHFHFGVGRSAEFCLAHLRAKHFGIFLGQVNQPAPVETDRRPENLSHSASFAVATAPSPLREGRPPTAYQGLAEGEPIKA